MHLDRATEFEALLLEISRKARMPCGNCRYPHGGLLPDFDDQLRFVGIMLVSTDIQKSLTDRLLTDVQSNILRLFPSIGKICEVV